VRHVTSQTSPQQETVGQRIRRLRGDLSHDKFAARLGTSRFVVIRWEKDVHVPGPEYRRRLAELTGRPESEFNGGGDAGEEAD
jgi:DNA-binding transcriptional regulator YiaG